MDSRRNVMVMWVVVAALCAPVWATGQESKPDTGKPGAAESAAKATPADAAASGDAAAKTDRAGDPSKKAVDDPSKKASDDSSAKTSPMDSAPAAAPGRRSPMGPRAGRGEESAKPGLDENQQRMIEVHRNKIRGVIEDKRALSEPKTVAELREKAGAGKPYALGQVAKADLKKDGALRLNCAKNAQGIKEFLVEVQGDKANVRAFVLFADEGFKGFMADSASTDSLEIEDPDHPALRAFVNWKPAESGFSIRFQAKANEDFGKAMAALLDPLVKNRTPPGVRGDEKMTPEERKAAFQEWLKNRRAAEATLQNEAPKLKVKYQMVPDWEKAKE